MKPFPICSNNMLCRQVVSGDETRDCWLLCSLNKVRNDAQLFGDFMLIKLVVDQPPKQVTESLFHGFVAASPFFGVPLSNRVTTSS